MDYLEDLGQELELLSAKLRERLGAIDQDLVELRQARTKVAGLLRQLDPQPRQNSKPKSHESGISQERYGEFVSWLQENRGWLNEEGFYGSGLAEDPRFTVIPNQSQVNKALAKAHEEGVVTLVSRGTGGRKNFKVV